MSEMVKEKKVKLIELKRKNDFIEKFITFLLLGGVYTLTIYEIIKSSSGVLTFILVVLVMIIYATGLSWALVDYKVVEEEKEVYIRR
jgi:Na+/citrate or Na+/malate symporter|tara:strand:- start:153 stop:413 length:261 start_codon:yes stop_codon:yes gene_type:complete